MLKADNETNQGNSIGSLTHTSDAKPFCFDAKAREQMLLHIVLYIFIHIIEYCIFPSYHIYLLYIVISVHGVISLLHLFGGNLTAISIMAAIYMVAFGPIALVLTNTFVGASIILTLGGPLLILLYYRSLKLSQTHLIIEILKLIFIYPKLMTNAVQAHSQNIDAFFFQEIFATCTTIISMYGMGFVFQKKLIENENRITHFQEELKATNNSLQQSLKEREHFILSLSHEVRNLLNIIIGNTELAFEDAMEIKLKEKLKNSKVCGDLLLSLINNVLDAGKLNLGNIEVCESETVIRSLIQKLWTTCSEIIKKKGLQGELKVNTNVPECLMLDQHRLTQILFNLIVNAVKFTHKGSITLKVSWHKAEEDENEIPSEDDHQLGRMLARLLDG